jgi:hypothetical protein
MSKQVSEDPDVTIIAKKSQSKQNSKPCDKVCIKTTPSESEVIDITPECEEISELYNSRPGALITRTHETKAACPSIDATDSECGSVISTVKNELQSKPIPVFLPTKISERSERDPVSRDSVHSTYSSFDTATAAKGRLDSKLSCIEKEYGAELVPAVLTDCKTTACKQIIQTELEIPAHSRTDSQTMNTTIVSVLEHSVEDTVCDHYEAGVFNSRYPSVSKKEVASLDNNLKVTHAVSDCASNRSEYILEPVVHKELNNNKLSGIHTTNASKCSNEKSLAADSAEHTTKASTSVDGFTSSATATISGTCIAPDDKVIPEESINIEQDGVVFSFCGNNKSKVSNFSNETSGNRELSAAQKCHLEETSAQIKVPERKSEEVSESQWGMPSGIQKVKAGSFRNIVSKEENTKHLKEHKEMKCKVTEKSDGGSCKSSASLVSDTVYCKQSKSDVITRNDKTGTSTKSDYLKNTPEIKSVISNHGDDGGGGKEKEGALLSIQLQGVLCGDQNKAKSSFHSVLTCDSPLEPAIKIKQHSDILKQPVVKLEPLPTETPLEDGDHDEQQLVTKQKNKSQRQRILSETSSNDGELRKNQEKTDSAEQTKVKKNSRLCLPKAKKTLSSTRESNTDAHGKSSKKSNTVSVDNIKACNSRPDAPIQNSVYSVDGRRTKTEQANKIRASSSSCTERMMVDDELFASTQRSKPVVKLERLDESALKSYGLVVLKTENASLNYTLDEDIIVISDDDDEYFPSSQIFNEQMTPLESFKTEHEDAAQEDLLFPKVLEDYDEDVLVFEDESDLNDDQWFRRLSQHDFEPEPISKVPLQELQAEKEKGDSGMREEEFMKDVDLQQAATNSEGIQKEMLAGDLLKTDEVEQKRDESVNKPKHSGKALVIDALPLPRRRAFQRGISAQAASRMYKEQVDDTQQQAKPTDNAHDTISRRGASRKKKKTHVDSSIFADPQFLTAKQKKQILDKRKEKLKAISEKEKAVAAAAKQASLMKVPAEVRIKVTNKNRGAFLAEGADTTNDVKASMGAQSSVLCPDVKNTFLSRNVQKRDSVKGSVPQPKKHEPRSSSATARNISDLPRIPKLSGRPSTLKNIDFMVPSCSADVVTDPVSDKLPVLTSAFSALSILKTSAPTICTKRKKNVRFKEGGEMVVMHEIPVEEGSRLRPVAHKKDAPTPRDVFSNQLQQKRPDIDEVLYDILCWNPMWLEVSCKYILHVKDGLLMSRKEFRAILNMKIMMRMRIFPARPIFAL